MKSKERIPLLLILVLAGLLCSAKINAQQRFILSGSVKSKKTGETIIGTSIKLQHKPGGITPNEYGFYSMTLTSGTYGLRITTPLINMDGDLKAGDVVRVDMLCIDENVYKYWYSLDQAATGNSSVTPANPVSNLSGGRWAILARIVYQ